MKVWYRHEWHEFKETKTMKQRNRGLQTTCIKLWAITKASIRLLCRNLTSVKTLSHPKWRLSNSKSIYFIKDWSTLMKQQRTLSTKWDFKEIRLFNVWLKLELLLKPWRMELRRMHHWFPFWMVCYVSLYCLLSSSEEFVCYLVFEEFIELQRIYYCIGINRKLSLKLCSCIKWERKNWLWYEWIEITSRTF